jgi:Transcriptional regulator
MGIRNREHKSYDPKTDAGDYIAKFTELNIALVICAVGMYMTVQSNIGLAPWMALSVGFQNITGINYGIWTNIIGVFVIAADIIMKEKIGFGTVGDCLLIGTYVSILDYFRVLPVTDNIFFGIIVMYFRNDFPDIMIRIDEGKLDDAESVLDHEKADFAIVIDNEEIRRNNKIELIPLYEDSPVALLPRKHPLSDVEKFPIRAFEDYPFIMQEGFTEYMYRVILEDNGIRPSVEATTSSDINLVSRVYSGFGLSLRSAQTMTNIRHGSIITKPLDIPFTYMVCIAYRKNDNLSPSAKGFIKFMTEHNAAEDKG